MAETHEFRAETSQLLNIVINSLYTNKEIFLRELISNASDALDRLRFEAISTPELAPPDHPFEIRLEPNPEARTLTVHDTGIGMTRDEVINNIGTIAQSGTRALIHEAAESGNREMVSKLIGQFGVGFYSAFMVADRVEIITRHAREENATLWRSHGDGQFTVDDASRERSGTSVTLHLKDVDEEVGLLDFTDPFVLQRIVKRYSDFITHPIICPMERTDYERDSEGTIVEGAEPKKVVEDRTLNAMKPIWTRPKSEVSTEEYAEFYRHVAHDWTEPLETITLQAEGRVEYRALLFIPSQAPFDFGLSATTWGLQLYAKQVMIMESCEELLPPFLRFVRGVVDSADLPLNISRETLQQDRHISQIRKWLTSKVLKTLDEMLRNNRETYLKFWSAFGRVLKEGVTGEHEYQERLRALFLFPSSNDPEQLTTLHDYITRMQPEQEAIYYLTGESRDLIESSPHLEAFREHGYEVLYLADPVDEIAVQYLTEYDGKPLRSAAKGQLDLGTEQERTAEKERLQQRTEELGDLLQTVQKTLDEHVSEVRLSKRLKSSPSCLVGEEHDLSPQLEKMLRHTPHAVPKRKRILELNPSHPIVQKLEQRFSERADDPTVGEMAELLLGSALLAEGSELPNPARFNSLLTRLMESRLSSGDAD